MAEVTAVVWRDWIMCLYWPGGTVPWVRYGVRVGRKRDWSVRRILRGPEGAVVIGWEGIRVRARNWEDRRERWSYTLRDWVSA